jgi:ribosomal protein S18 acetylase RimI-like enzyme
MATINWVVCPDTGMSDTVIERLLGECISFLREKGVKFVSAHISGDNVRGLHLLEDKGFRYYQTTVYPVAQCTDLAHEAESNVRLWQESDLPAIIQIAKHHQFSHGHFYCDDKFDRKAVDSMYEKWIRTSWKNKEPVAVIENGGEVAGYFAFVMDEPLSQAMKYKYGRMTSLAMDSSARGKGLGSNLFRAVMSLIAEMGGQYIASEYPLRNFASGKLHIKNLFCPVHEKVLLHLWL